MVTGNDRGIPIYGIREEKMRYYQSCVSGESLTCNHNGCAQREETEFCPDYADGGQIVYEAMHDLKDMQGLLPRTCNGLCRQVAVRY